MVAVAFSPSLYFLAEVKCIYNCLPNNGLSEVTGIVADTMFKNTVRLRRIVTPGMKSDLFIASRSRCLASYLSFSS